MDGREYVILRTYSSVWNVETKIYSIENFKLLVPIKPREAVYFILGFAITKLILTVLPFFQGVPFVIKWLLIPYGIMKFLTKQKLDGKLPHKFFIEYVMFKLGPKRFSKFKSVEEYKNIKFTTVTSKRDRKIINKTQEALKEEKKKSFFSFSKKSSGKKDIKKKKKTKKFKKGERMRVRQ